MYKLTVYSSSQPKTFNFFDPAKIIEFIQRSWYARKEKCVRALIGAIENNSLDGFEYQFYSGTKISIKLEQ